MIYFLVMKGKRCTSFLCIRNAFNKAILELELSCKQVLFGLFCIYYRKIFAEDFYSVQKIPTKNHKR